MLEEGNWQVWNLFFKRLFYLSNTLWVCLIFCSVTVLLIIHLSITCTHRHTCSHSPDHAHLLLLTCNHALYIYSSSTRSQITWVFLCSCRLVSLCSEIILRFLCIFNSLCALWEWSLFFFFCFFWTFFQSAPSSFVCGSTSSKTLQTLKYGMWHFSACFWFFPVIISLSNLLHLLLSGHFRLAPQTTGEI